MIREGDFKLWIERLKAKWINNRNPIKSCIEFETDAAVIRGCCLTILDWIANGDHLQRDAAMSAFDAAMARREKLAEGSEIRQALNALERTERKLRELRD